MAFRDEKEEFQAAFALFGGSDVTVKELGTVFRSVAPGRALNCLKSLTNNCIVKLDYFQGSIQQRKSFKP